MKSKILFVLCFLLSVLAVTAQPGGGTGPTLREATDAEMAAGTAAFPAVVTPRKMQKGGYSPTNGLTATQTTNVANNVSRSVTTNDPSVLATFLSQGVFSTNAYAASLSSPGWQGWQELTPWGAQKVGSYSDFTNLMQSVQNLGGTFDFKYIETEQEIFATNRANGNLFWNSNNFPMGPAGFANMVHTNGYQWLLWYDGNAASMAPANGSVTQYVADIQTFVSWKPDRVWFDGQGYLFNLMLSIAATNSPFIPISPGIDMTAPNAESISKGNGWRFHGPSGDLHSWADWLIWADYIDTNGWRLVSPGHQFFLGPEANYTPTTGGGANALETSVVLQAIWSANNLGGFAVTPFNTYGTSFWTNSNVRSVRADSGSFPARRVGNTNGCWIYLKPLKTERGPEFVLAVISTNKAPATTNVTLNFSDYTLPKCFPYGGVFLAETNYSIYSLNSNAYTAMAATNLTLTGIETNYYRWFKLTPGTAVTTNYIQPFAYNATLPALIISNGVSQVVNLPWDADATNFIARAQLTNDPVQCFAVQFLFSKLKAANVWTNRLDVLYPMVPWRPYLNALSTSFSLVPVGTVTSNSLGIAGDGAASYFTNGYYFNSSAVKFTQNSASVGVYVGTQTPTDNGTFFGGWGPSGGQLYLIRSGTTLAGIANDQTQVGPSGVTDFRGLNFVTRISSTQSAAGNRSTLTAIGYGSVNSIGVPSSAMLFDAAYQNGTTPNFFSNAQLQGAWIGNGITITEAQTLSGIWDEYEAILGRKAP